MIYPKFLKKNDLIGLTALSGGCNSSLKELKVSVNHLKEDYQVLITPDVYGEDIVSASKEQRIKEFNELLDENIKFLFIARGGDFLYETLDGLDFDKLKEKEIWVEGASDPTSLLYILTTKYDLATIYGNNGKSFSDDILLSYQKDNLEIIKGNLICQESERETVSLNGDFESKGMIIGGCLDILRYLVGTKYDTTLQFIEKYHDKGIIWYFDIFSMDSVETYLTLLQLKNIGFFKYSNTFIFGSILFPKEECNLSYIEAYKKVFNDKNIIFNANIGHVKPCMTIINGSIAKVKYQKNKFYLEQGLGDNNEDIS